MTIHLLTRTIPSFSQLVIKSDHLIIAFDALGAEDGQRRATDLYQELLECHLALGYKQNVLDDGLILLQVKIPELAKGEVAQDPADGQAFHQLHPVALLHRLRLQRNDQRVHFCV